MKIIQTSKTQVNRTRFGWKEFLFGFALSSSIGGVALADDIETFFPDADSTSTVTVKPNIMFIMDTSGSMSSTDGGSESRLDRVKRALNLILNEMSPNTNVGLMRLSDDEGGPVLFPVSPIEAQVSDIEESCVVADGSPPGSVAVVSNAGDASDTAMEAELTGVTTLSPPVLEMGSVGAVAGGGDTATFAGASVGNRRNSFDDAEQRSNGDNFNRQEGKLQFGRRDVGLRFPGITIPKEATIKSARLEIVITDRRKNNTSVQIHAERVPDSLDFNALRDVVSRPRTGQNQPWTIPSTNRSTERVSSPDIAHVIQEIVDQDDWAEGNALSLIIPGSGRREALNNTKGNNRPRLIIEYEAAASAATKTSVGLRFPNVFVPNGAQITSAYVDFKPAVVRTDTASFVIHGEAADDSEPLTAGIDVLKDRAKTAASVAWPSGAVGDWDDIVLPLPTDDVPAGKLRNSPDISPIVQEIVKRTDWCGGNALTIFVSPSATNTGGREFHSGLLDSDLAPTLHLTYDENADNTGCNQNFSVSQIGERNDDAEERISNGSMSLGSSDLELGFDGSNKQIVGMRFTNVQIPKGGEVVESDITFTAKGMSFGSSTITFTVEDVDDAGAFGSAAQHLTNRQADSVPGSVTWSVPDFEFGDEAYTTPDLSELIQKVVNRAGWQPGNSIAIFASGSGTRRAWSVDGSSAKSPRLSVKSKGIITGKTVRQKLKEIVDGLVNTGFTPVVEVLTEAAKYYRGEDVHFGRTRGSGKQIGDNDNGDGSNQDDLTNARVMRISHCASYTGGKEENPPGCSEDNLDASACEKQHISGNPVYITPIEHACQSNNIVLLTDGLPNSNTNTSLVHAIAGSGCNGNNCGPHLAGYLANNDQHAGLAGDQTVNTYTIGFADFASRSYLEDIAEEGNGTFSPASDAEDLADRFREIIAEILDKNTTFVAPAVTINAFNRLTHLDQLYFALFRPQVEVHWNGNLKRFRLRASPSGIVDLNGDPAVNPETGFFFEDAFSFWPDGSGQPDGGFVTKGGAANQLPDPVTRKMYTNISGNDLTSGGNELSIANAALDDDLLETDGQPVGTRELVISWARGIDVDDDDADGDRTDFRNQLGDPLHSEPALVTYGGSEDDPDITVFMGTNEGFLHAFNGKTGREEFAFIPKELLPNLAVMRKNQGSYRSRPYGMDGPITALVERAGSSAVTKVDLVAGMRRGGDSYYSLDVSNRASPKLNWQIKGGQGDFAELGQTWSATIPAKVQFGGATESVLFFSGGYDVNQDSPKSDRLSDGVGRALFMVRASDGKLLWWAGNPEKGPNLGLSEMQASVPASPTVVDLDDNGFADRIYIADTNAKVFRFDINPSNSGAANFAQGNLFADLGGSDASQNRRFYNAPDVAFVQPGDVDPLLTVSIGSGYRAHPLEKGVQDRFYVLFDPDVLPSKRKFFDDGAIDAPDVELYDATDNDIGSANAEAAAAARKELFEKRGAFINMRPSEKVLTVSRTFDSTVVFATFQPGESNSNVCAAGEGLARLYALDVIGLTPATDLNESGGEPTKGDRDKELGLGGVPPNPVILFPDSGKQPIEPITCIGPECVDLGFNVTTTKTFWTEMNPWAGTAPPPAPPPTAAPQP